MNTQSPDHADRHRRSFFTRAKQRLRSHLSRAAIGNIIHKFQPKPTGHALVRIGPNGDGGYLVPDDLAGISACFSPGVSDVCGFEDGLADEYGIPSFMADRTVDGPPHDHRLFHFTKKHLGAENTTTTMRMDDWVNTHAPAGDLLLEMDIEGGEYTALPATSPAILRRFRIVVLELHDLQRLNRAPWRRRFNQSLDTLFADFTVAHISPNNGAPLATLGPHQVPPVLEVTFLRRDRIRPGGPAPVIPHPLDVRNHRDKPPLDLPKAWLPPTLQTSPPSNPRTATSVPAAGKTP